MPRVVSPNSWFKGTVVAVLDAELRVLGWTWLVNAPQHQVSRLPSANKWQVPVGSADGFPPPWAKTVYDVRLIDVAGHLFVTYVCNKCAFSVAKLQLTGEAKADGGVYRLRAWQSHRFTTPAPWAQGRNQALFTAARARGGAAELMVQPWLGVVGSFGPARFKRSSVLCAWRRSQPTEGVERAGLRQCGTTPANSLLSLDRVADATSGHGTFGLMQLLSNHSRPELQRDTVGGFRLSSTSNLLHVVRGRGRERCEAFLGVGHTHRAEGKLNRRMAKRMDRRTKDDSADSSGVFMWGFKYTHFFYTVEPHLPFRTLATSGEFCIESTQNQGDCESVQFVSGIAHAHSDDVASKRPPALLLSYGVNDCEAKVGQIFMQRVWQLLRPLAGVDDVCTPLSMSM